MYKLEKAVDADMEAILELQKLAYRSEAEVYNDFSIPPLTQSLSSFMDEVRDAVVLKVVVDGEIIASIRFRRMDNTCLINKLMVHPDFENRGIGKALLAEVEVRCPAERYELYTGFLSEKNLALYERLGYQRFKTSQVLENISFIYLEKRAL